MTHTGERDILEALHRLEIRFTERLTRLEAKIEGQTELATQIECVDLRQQRLIVAVALLSLVTLGDASVRIGGMLL